MSKMFEQILLKNISLNNRIIRAATYEGGGDGRGVPTEKLKDLYVELANNNVGLIITGFCNFSDDGKALQPLQCAIRPDTVSAWKEITDAVHSTPTKICMQISHAGRQTRGKEIFAPSSVKCSYFRQKPKELNDSQILQIIDQYAMAAVYAKNAGFDGVQIHCAHGYLIHQFLSPFTNRRSDRWGIDRSLFARMILEKISSLCGPDFLLLIKLSGGDERGLNIDQVIKYAQEIESLGCVHAIELSYGTMEFAMNIFRGAIPLSLVMKVNPLFNHYPKIVKWLWKKIVYPSYLKKIKPFTSIYNLQNAIKLKQAVRVPIILTGGIRSIDDLEKVSKADVEMVSICRPLICEPDWVTKLVTGHTTPAKCINCNLCTVMCDSDNFLRCYYKKV